jgi:hypothetical protein
MGWNDRLPDDPYRPYESQDDRDAYDNWQMYLEHCRQEELTSQNIDPASVNQFRPVTMVDMCRDLLSRLLKNSRADQKKQKASKEKSSKK